MLGPIKLRLLLVQQLAAVRLNHLEAGHLQQPTRAYRIQDDFIENIEAFNRLSRLRLPSEEVKPLKQTLAGGPPGSS